jgi:hypothetical protein
VRATLGAVESTDIQQSQARKPSIMRKVGAGLVLVIGAMIAIKIIAGIVAAVFWSIVAVAVVIAILWALKTIFW